MSTSLIVAILAIVLLPVAFMAGRWTSVANVARRRYERDAGKAPLWLRNYKDNPYSCLIFERILTYFDKEQPYLNPNLSIADVAKEVCTNRSYVAKAIKVYSGRNFCQFVNSYRVDYAVALSKKEPDLKVCELSFRSGFNSPTAFSIAFKLIRGMPPGEWLRCNKS